MAKGIKIFNLTDSYGGGGTIFEDGVYRVEKSLFTMFDFGGSFPGKDGDGACCLMWKLQPVDAKTHKPLDKEPVVQYWGAGDETQPLNKGKEIGLREDATHDVIWRGSDFYKFMEQLQKAKFDMDKYEDEGDVSIFEGMVFEMGKIPDTYQKEPKAGKDLDGEKGKDKERKGPRLIVIVTGVPKQQAASKSKTAAEEAEEKPAKKKPAADSDEPEDLVENFLVKSILTDDNEDGIEKIVARAQLNKAITKSHDAEKAKECIQYWNKNLAAVLKAHGWELEDDTIKKG